MSVPISTRFALAILCASINSAAQEFDRSPWRPNAVFTQVAGAEHTRSVSGGFQWRWRNGWGLSDRLQLDGYIESEFGRWRTQTERGSNRSAWTNQLSVVPTLRLTKLTATPSLRWYADIGVGPSYLTPKFHNHDTLFSTRFQFRNHLGIGMQWGTSVRHDIALRGEHFSNAGYKRPNPGVNLIAVRYTRPF
jgi:lipid A 3-O-deacylase